MSGLVAYKMTGSGNDFVMLDGRITDAAAWPAALTQVLCDRRVGMGADAVVFVTPGSGPGRVRMTYFNSDGSPAPMCGNAALCTAQLARRLEIVGDGPIILETGAGPYDASCPTADRARLRLGGIERPTPMAGAELGPGETRSARACVGVPHIVVLVADVAVVDVSGRGRELRFHPGAGPDGANVNFVARGNGARNQWAMRTYERGVEGETFACATGAAAATAALAAWGVTEPPLEVVTRTGLVLRIDGRRLSDGGLDDVWVEGEARLVYRAVVDLL